VPQRTRLLGILAGAAAVSFAIAGLGWLALLFGAAAGALLAPRTSRRAAPGAAQDRAGDDPCRSQLDAVLASVSEGVLIVDRDGLVRAASPVAAALLGVPFASGADGRAQRLSGWPQLERVVADCLQGGEPQRFEGSPTARAELTLAVQVASWRRDGALAGVVVVLDDLSRLRELEAHRRDFVANVSHELKTPLAAIQGFVETMIDDTEMPEPTQRRFLERIAVQSERLGTLVRDLLTLSRLDAAAGLSLASEPCDLSAVVRDVVADLLPLAERKPVRVVVELPPLPVPVAAERESLRQIASNLLDNAIKYTPPEGSVTVRLQRAAQAELEVRDTGIGLSPADQERVFERFYRVDKARSRELGGTGLGLSIVKNTVKGLGGTLGVRSELGRGSTFWVRLPMAT
jgi:two-component system phosphate regulon sensor histidine kinase PhoR